MPNTTKTWQGTKQKTCDVCYNQFTDVFYDARLPLGHWALICHSCFTNMALKLGLGHGQKYSTTTLEKLDG